MKVTTEAGEEKSSHSRHVDGTWAVLDIAREIRFLADSFADVGNTVVSEKLINKAERLEDAANGMDKAYSDLRKEHGRFAKDTTEGLLGIVLSKALGPE